MRRIFLFFCVGILLTLFGCDERKSTPVGSDVIDRDDWGEFREVCFQPAAQDTFYHEAIPANTGPLLLVGAYHGFQTKSLLKFELPQNIQVIQTSVILATYDVISEEQLSEADSMWIIISLTETDWSDSTLTFDSPLSETPVETVAVKSSSDNIFSFSLPPEEIQSLIDSQHLFISLLLSSAQELNTTQGTEFIKKFYSSEFLTPLLSITWTETDTSDTTLGSIEDVFVVNRDIDWPADVWTDRLVVGNGYRDRTSFSYRSFLKFEIPDSISEASTVIWGKLTLYPDDVNSFFNNVNVGIYAVTSPNWDDLEFDSDTESEPIDQKTVTLGQDAIVFDIRSVIQDWISGKRQNYGLRVKSIDEDWDITSSVFHSSQSDPGLGPKLEVAYATPPEFGSKGTEEVSESEP
ncbi:MAG: DNRLRE domain-containing protein [Gemmatimonadota bacterium]|nr:MAG: DNRLRE domain-containing protein [Gemmatimonadota bacterium]